VSTGTAFREVQHLRQPVLLALVGLAALLQWVLVVYYLVLDGTFGGERPSTVAILAPWALLGVGLPLLVWSVRLVTEVSPAGLVVGLAPFSRREVPASAVAASRVARHRPLREFGGFGARWASGGRRAYTAGGEQAVEVDLHDGTQLVLGTRRPEELQSALATLGPPGREPRGTSRLGCRLVAGDVGSSGPGLVSYGTGHVEVAPDTLLVRLGTQAEAEGPTSALEQANQAAAAVVEALRAAGIGPADLRTESADVHQAYDPGPEPGAPPRPTRFVASTNFAVRLRLGDAGAARAEAASRAVAAAFEQARALAAAAGVSLGPVRRLEELPGGGVPGPRPMAMRAERAMAAGPPIEAGVETITVSVFVEHALGDP
jgi:uncharacterized protein YggE